MPTAAPSPSPARNQPILLLRSSDIEPPMNDQTKVNVSTRIVFLQIVTKGTTQMSRDCRRLRGFIHQHAIESWIQRGIVRQLLHLLEAHRVTAMDALRKLLLPQHRHLMNEIVAQVDCPI